MRRPSRSVEVFSLSALDLFASAMGAFILMAVIMLPDYLNISQVRAEVDALKDSVSHLESQKEALESQLDQGRTNALLGISTSADSFVFLIDTSGSMVEFSDRLELISAQALAGLTEDQTAQLIGFSGSPGRNSLAPWQSPGVMQPMTDADKLAADQFIQGLAASFGGTTPTNEALLEALTYDAEAIILITDGAPSDGGSDAEIVQRVTMANAGAKEIHAIGIGAYTQNTTFRDFLIALTEQNRGQFMGFPSPAWRVSRQPCSLRHRLCLSDRSRLFWLW